MHTPSLRLVAALLAACPASLAIAGGAQAAIPVLGSSAPRAEIQTAAPLPRGAVLGPSLAPSTRLSLTVALTPRAGLSAYAAAVSDPRSPLYRHYLSVGQFRRRFGASPAGVAAVRAVLGHAGLRAGALSRNGLALAISGRASRIEGAFQTRLDRVTLHGRRHAYLDVRAPTLPTRVASLVQSVVGLDSLPLMTPQGLQRGHAHAHEVTGAGPTTCLAAGEVDDANTAQEIASAYGLQSLWNAGDVGAGATVALYELEPFSASDIAAYKSCYGLSTSVHVTDVDGGAGSGSGAGEAALDIEDVAGLAPGATIDVYEGPNGGDGPYDVYSEIVQADTAQVVSTSWGLCESELGAADAQAESTLFAEAAAQGQTVFAAAGDAGADDCEGTADAGTAAVDDPASQPDVTGVGGTSLADSWADPSAETVWNDGSGYGAGGGGVSSLWPAPSYQSSLGATMREVPDVSADADPDTGYAIYWERRWTDVGGTSAAAPTWAALTALALGSSSCDANTRGLGLINDTLYSLPESDFYDVTSGDNSYEGVTGYRAGTGYDMASGLGAPNGQALVPALCDPAAATTTAPTTTAPTTTAPTTTAPTTTAPTTTTTPTTTPTTTTTTTSAPPASTGTTSTGSSSTGTSAPPRRHPAPATVIFDVPGRERDALGASVRVVLRAGDRAGRRLTYSAVGLPRGLRIARATGAVTGRPLRLGIDIVSVTAQDSAGDARTVVIRWTVARARRRRRHR